MRPNVDLLKRSLPIVAAAMGNRNGVKVCFQADAETAMTDGQVIILPQLPNDDPDAVDLVRGYIDHEAAHVRHTDFAAGKPDHPVIGQMCNILEDVRIETASFRQYPGAHDNAVKLTEVLLKRDQVFKLKPEDEDAHVVLGAVFTALQANHIGNEELAARADDYHDEMQKRMPGLMPRIMALAHEVGNCESTADCVALSTSIGDVIQQYEQEKQEEAQKPQPQSGKQQKPDGPGQQQGNGGGQTPKQAQQSAQAASNILQAKPESVPQCDIGAMAAGAIGQSHDEAAAEGTLGCGAGSEVPHPAPAGTPHLVANTVARHGSYLRAKLQSIIQTNSVTRSRVNRNGIRIADRLIHRVRIGDARVFRSREVKRKVDTAVFVLGDISGSMSGSVRLVLEAAMTLALGLDGVAGASCAVGVFPAGDTSNVSMLTRFDEAPKATEKRYLLHTNGGTPMSEALWYAAQQLYLRREPRKLCVVCTDGAPNNPAATLDVLKRMQSAGIETIGIGIGTTSVENLFQTSCVISSVSELGSTLVNIVARNYCIN